MAQSAQCSTTGPFYPTTSSAIIQTGISVSQDILKEPDWAIIFILLGSAFLAMVIMVLLLVCRLFLPLFELLDTAVFRVDVR